MSFLLASCFAWPIGVFAETCGGSYLVAPGDNLSSIALRTYKDAGKWTSIHTANLDVIGEDPDRILIGTELRLGCVNGLPKAGPAPASAISAFHERADPETKQPRLGPAGVGPARRGISPLRVVTGDGQEPFSDQSLSGGGMLAEVMTAAISAGFDERPYEIFRINDWGSHLDPLLSKQLMDVSFPWPKPDCRGSSGGQYCEGLVYSEPMFELLMQVFVRRSDPVSLVNLPSSRKALVCRPAGRMTFMLDQGGRNWLRDKEIELVQAPSVAGCFDLLMKAEVDFVVANEFTGREVLRRRSFKDEIAAVANAPLGIVTLHAVASNENPQAKRTIRFLNKGLQHLRRSGEYQEIVDRHLAQVWAGL
ncbi:peptidoglycan-binding protein LysM [Roseobacter sp. EG26]|uniref:peptidoglycan-binding protein LysM n=1 Tax=Roseobacter sp. EG26 TaxID=3412477 RepID=UPI003CE4AB38